MKARQALCLGRGKKLAHRSGVHQGEDARLFCFIAETAEAADFLNPAEAVEGVEKTGIARGQTGRFKITPAQIGVPKRTGRLRFEKVEPQPAAIGPGNALRLAEESDDDLARCRSLFLRFI